MKLSGGQALTIFKNLLITVVVVVALVAAQLWIWQSVESSGQTLLSRQTETEQLSELNGRIAVIEQNYQAQVPLLDQLAVVFPQQSQTSQIVDRLEQLADKQGVDLTIENIETQPAAAGEKKSSLVPLQVTMQVSGPATTLLQYLAALEHIQELAVIKEWQLQPLKTAPAPGAPLPDTHQLMVNVIFYLQME